MKYAHLLMILFIVCNLSLSAQSLTINDAIFVAKQIKRSPNWEAMPIVSVTDTLRNRGYMLMSAVRTDTGTAPQRHRDIYIYQNIHNAAEKLTLNVYAKLYSTFEVNEILVTLEADEYNQFQNWYTSLFNNSDFGLVFSQNMQPFRKVFNYHPLNQSNASQVTLKPRTVSTGDYPNYQVVTPLVYTAELRNIHD